MTTLLAHEWLSPIGGSENVFEHLAKLLPGARRICLWNDAPHRFAPHEIEETWLARTPLRRSKAAALPLLSTAWRSVDLSGVERVVASSHAFSHHLASRASHMGIPSYAYVYSPARYIWAPEHDDRGQKRTAKLGRSFLQRLDRRSVSSKVSYVAISEFVRARIQNAWDVEAQVIYPPVEVERITSVSDWRTRVRDPNELAMLSLLPTEFVLGASRLVEYKRVEAAITAGESLDLPVVIAGDGPDEMRLRSVASRANVPVQFVGTVSNQALYSLYQATNLFVFMPIEDFGIMPVEAIALGTNVLVNDVGGTKEIVDALGKGVAVSDAPERIRDAAGVAAALRWKPDPADASYFSSSRFAREINSWLGREPSSRSLSC